jgi:hypothetical protein
VLIGAACCFPQVSLPPSEPLPKRIFGVYGSPSQNSHTGGRDTIRVTPGQNRQVRVAIKLYYANGHTCQLDREGEWHGDHVLIVADGLNENEPCKLEAYFPEGRILLKDEGQRCAQVYCGTRGKLDAVSLIKKRSAHN